MPDTQSFDPRPRGGLSHVVGDTRPVLWRKTIGQLLSETADRYPDHEALVFSRHGTRLTYRALETAVDELAAGLHRLGLRAGDRIGIWAPNRPEWVLIQFATAKLGLILVNINPAYRLSELEYALNKVGCAALITAVYAAADEAGSPTVYWLTQQDNTTARKLYDQIGVQTDFIKYQRPA